MDNGLRNDRTLENSDKVIETLVAEMKNGRRSVLYPPGMLVFVLVNMLLLGGFLCLCAVLISASELQVPQKAILQLVSILIFVIIIVIPALMLTRGKSGIRLWLLGCGAAIALISFVLLMLGVIDMSSEYSAYKLPLFWGLMGGSISAYLCRSEKYRQFVYFYYLLKKPDN